MKDIANLRDLERALVEQFVQFSLMVKEMVASGRRRIRYETYRDSGAWALVPRYTPEFLDESTGEFGLGFTKKTPADRLVEKFDRKRDALLKKHGIEVV